MDTDRDSRRESDDSDGDRGPAVPPWKRDDYDPPTHTDSHTTSHDPFSGPLVTYWKITLKLWVVSLLAGVAAFILQYFLEATGMFEILFSNIVTGLLSLFLIFVFVLTVPGFIAFTLWDWE